MSVIYELGCFLEAEITDNQIYLMETRRQTNLWTQITYRLHTAVS